MAGRRSGKAPPTRTPAAPPLAPGASRGASQSNLFSLVGRLVDRFGDSVDHHLLRRHLILRLLAQDGDEMRELGAIGLDERALPRGGATRDRKSTRLNSSHGYISYAV